jgi:hypothetical protein
MGLTLTAYVLLAVTVWVLFYTRSNDQARSSWLRPLHLFWYGAVSLVLVLLAIGVIGTLGEYGRLGHSIHLLFG